MFYLQKLILISNFFFTKNFNDIIKNIKTEKYSIKLDSENLHH